MQQHSAERKAEQLLRCWISCGEDVCQFYSSRNASAVSSAGLSPSCMAAPGSCSFPSTVPVASFLSACLPARSFRHSVDTPFASA
eukprot:scaffold86_cov338-Pavlova_lutheri.AAC.122